MVVTAQSFAATAGVAEDGDVVDSASSSPGSASSRDSLPSLRADRRRRRRSIGTDQYHNWAASRVLESLQSPESLFQGPEVPAPRAPPRGFFGLFHEQDLTGILDTSQFPRGMVLLNVYDFSSSEIFQKVNTFSTVNSSLLLGGVFHAGVELYDCEWGYGFVEDGSGVAMVAPRTHRDHKYRFTVPLGPTQRTESQVEEVLTRLSEEWPGHLYNTVHRNCLSFCNCLCTELGVRRIPTWIDRVPRTVSFFDKAFHSLADSARRGLQLVTASKVSTCRGVESDLGDEAAQDDCRDDAIAEAVVTHVRSAYCDPDQLSKSKLLSVLQQKDWTAIEDEDNRWEPLSEFLISAPPKPPDDIDGRKESDDLASEQISSPYYVDKETALASAGEDYAVCLPS